MGLEGEETKGGVTWMTGRRNKIRSGNRGRYEVGECWREEWSDGKGGGVPIWGEEKGREIEKGEIWREGRASRKGP